MNGRERKSNYMTVNDTHVLLIEQAAQEQRDFEASLRRCLLSLTTTPPSKRETEARQISLQCAAVMRAVLAARMCSETLERTLAHARGVDIPQ